MAEKKIKTSSLHRLVHKISHLIEEYYPFPEKAQKMIAHIQKELSQGGYDNIENAYELAQTLTRDLQNNSHDYHITVIFSPKVAAQISKKQKLDPLDENYESNWWQWVNSDNFGIPKIEYLIGNIGYIDIRYFAPVNLAGDVAVAAMNFLARSEALIFDLRQCGGGDPFMTQIFQSYLYNKDKKPKLLLTKYHHAKNQVQQEWTYPYIPGKRLPEAPVYILTSSRTFSGGEDMAYSLKHHGRATVVGEITGGGAHPVTELLPGEGFILILPEGYPTHPVTNSNWEGTGVQPDIEIASENALEIAHRHAIQSLYKNNDNQADAHNLKWYLQRLDAIYKPLKLNPRMLKKFTGKYRDYEVTLKGGSLILSRIGRRDNWAMVPISENTFTADEDYNVRFEMSEDDITSALIWLGRDSSKEIRMAKTG